MNLPRPAIDPVFLSFQLALAGRYSIDREIGRGGMGIVYLAREVHLDRPVAIKLLPPVLAENQDLRNRFLREARLAAKLSHPNIIPIHAVDEAGGFVFYVMSYIDGETLAQRVQARGPLPVSEGTRVLREAAFALAHAHEQGLVHRDVKPDNILLESGSGRALVADFGIAAAAGDAATGTDEGVPGTPEFMSPEAALGAEQDARSDIYSLGATAYYAFSGRLPFEGKTATEILARKATEAAPPLASVGMNVPRKLGLLVDRCLAREPEHRPASADVMAEQLGVALEQRRELPAALRAFVKRNGRLDGGGTIVGTAAVTSGAVAVSYLYGMVPGFAVLALGSLTLPLAGLAEQARRLLLNGFDHGDLAPAFKAEVERSREELAVDRRHGQSRLERLAASVTRIALTVSAPLIAAAVYTFKSLPPTGPGHPLLDNYVIAYRNANELMVLSVAAGSTGFIAAAIWGYLAERRIDIATVMWAKIWRSRVGRLAFAIARRFTGNRMLGSAVTHRATEISLGMAAENLFESLPRETRNALGDLPSVVHRLRDDAQLLRRRHDELQEALNDAGDAASSIDYADVRSARDELQLKMRDAVGALETIRLNLLRMHAGSITVEGLTTHIDVATEVSAEVERLLAAHDEIERGLAFPREIETTPV